MASRSDVDLSVDREQTAGLAREVWNQHDFGRRFFAHGDVERIVLWGRFPAILGAGTHRAARLSEGQPRRGLPHLLFWQLNPDLYGIRGRLTWFDSLLEPPSPGTWILSSFCVARIQAYLQIRFGDGPLNWLYYAEPKAIVGYAYYVYDIKPDELLGEAPTGKEHPVFPTFCEP
jgi:hypothetical protein